MSEKNKVGDAAAKEQILSQDQKWVKAYYKFSSCDKILERNKWTICARKIP